MKIRRYLPSLYVKRKKQRAEVKLAKHGHGKRMEFFFYVTILPADEEMLWGFFRTESYGKGRLLILSALSALGIDDVSFAWEGEVKKKKLTIKRKKKCIVRKISKS